MKLLERLGIAPVKDDDTRYFVPNRRDRRRGMAGKRSHRYAPRHVVARRPLLGVSAPSEKALGRMVANRPDEYRALFMRVIDAMDAEQKRRAVR